MRTKFPGFEAASLAIEVQAVILSLTLTRKGILKQVKETVPAVLSSSQQKILNLSFETILHSLFC
jgi:hypothetical protein